MRRQGHGLTPVTYLRAGKPCDGMAGELILDAER